MTKEVPQPWITSPDVWPTKASFFSYLRGALRRAIWEKYPPKIQFKNEQCSPPPEDIETRAKTGAYCALSGVWEGKSKLEVDHKEGNASINDWDEVLGFIQHLCVDKDGMSLVTKEAHKIKSYSERMGISYEEAVVEKECIAICKLSVGEQNKWLEDRGVDPKGLNAKSRRDAVRAVLKTE